MMSKAINCHDDDVHDMITLVERWIDGFDIDLVSVKILKCNLTKRNWIQIIWAIKLNNMHLPQHESLNCIPWCFHNRADDWLWCQPMCLRCLVFVVNRMCEIYLFVKLNQASSDKTPPDFPQFPNCIVSNITVQARLFPPGRAVENNSISICVQ